MPNYLSTKEAAEYIGVSEMTLRRWDKSGKFKPSFISPGGHRSYLASDLDRLTKGIWGIAEAWAKSDEILPLSSDLYCRTNDVFRTRLDRMMDEMSKDGELEQIASLIGSLAGEVGNNSFDHNLGNWPDVMGVFFAHDLKKRQVVLADRGRGILATLKNVRPELSNDVEALQVAFTEILSGRAPENRGNGLKYVRKVANRQGFHVVFQSGNAELVIEPEITDVLAKETESRLRGCACLIEF